MLLGNIVETKTWLNGQWGPTHWVLCQHLPQQKLFSCFFCVFFYIFCFVSFQHWKGFLANIVIVFFFIFLIFLIVIRLNVEQKMAHKRVINKLNILFSKDYHWIFFCLKYKFKLLLVYSCSNEGFQLVWLYFSSKVV